MTTTNHKFVTTKEFAGSYVSCCGIQMEVNPQSGWNITWPGERTPDEWTNTLKDAKAIAENHHAKAGN